MKQLRAFLILLLAIASGCVTRVERMQPVQPAAPAAPATPKTAAARAGQSQTVTDKRVVIDPALNRVIHVVRITSKVSPEGYLKIQLNVQNLTTAFKRFHYRIDWYDQDGLALPLAGVIAMDWSLLSGETSFLAATAPTPAARDFRVTFLAN